MSTNFQAWALPREHALKHSPYLAPILYLMVPREDPSLTLHGEKALAGVTRDGLLLHRAEVLERPARELGGLMLHYAWHLLLGHHAPNSVRPDARLRHLAQSMSINDMLVRSNAALPPTSVLPSMYGLEPAQTWETYYDLLQQQESKGKPPPSPKANDPFAGGGGSGAGRPFDREPEPKPPQGENGEGDGDGDSRPDPGDAPVEGEGRAPEEVEEARVSAILGAQEHAQKNAGSIPAGLLRDAAAALEPPKVRWQATLRRVVARDLQLTRGFDDYRRDRPSLRQPAYHAAARRHGWKEPLLSRPVGLRRRVLVGVDTSGSMSQRDLSVALREVNGLLRHLGDVRFVTCDAQVHSDLKVTSWREAARNLKGGGGTDLQPILDLAAHARRDRPDAVVVITDGGLFREPVAPGRIPVIWLVTPGNSASMLKFGTVIEMTE